MITAIEIENFKGIGGTQRIEFAALTLIFGPNSAGKSSIIHALHFLREVLETGNGDVDQVRSTNGDLRLGGFESLIHCHEKDERKIRIRADFPLSEYSFLRRKIGDLKRLAEVDYNAPLLNVADTFGIEIFVGTQFDTSDNISHPLVERMNLYLDGVLIVGSQATPCAWEGGDEGTVANLVDINLEHPCFNKLESQSIARVIAETFHYSPEQFEFNRREEGAYGSGVISDALGAIPTSESVANVLFVDHEDYDSEDDITIFYRSVLESRFKQFFIALLVDAVKHSLRLLTHLSHVGPIREIPERSRRYTFKTNQQSWYKGQAAWQRLLEENPTPGLMALAGRYPWYSYELDLRELLAAPYIIERRGIWTTCESWWQGGRSSGAKQRNLEVVLRDTRTDTIVALEDVGVGISQVIPVLVAAQDQAIPILFVEQPELHLHPKQQAMVGDFFALQTDSFSRSYRSAHGTDLGGRTIIIETHSELLLLRMLRRIRESRTPRTSGHSKEPRLKANDLRIYAVESTESGTIFRVLPISDSGSFIGSWPEGFFDERIDEI